MGNMIQKSGMNDCHWNTKGRCANPKMWYNTRKHGGEGDSFYCWNSKVNCTYTQFGTTLCRDHYKKER